MQLSNFETGASVASTSHIFVWPCSEYWPQWAASMSLTSHKISQKIRLAAANLKCANTQRDTWPAHCACLSLHVTVQISPYASGRSQIPIACRSNPKPYWNCNNCILILYSQLYILTIYIHSNEIHTAAELTDYWCIGVSSTCFGP